MGNLSTVFVRARIGVVRMQINFIYVYRSHYNYIRRSRRSQ